MQHTGLRARFQRGRIRTVPELTIGSADFDALASQILGAGHTVRFRARGVSMDPFILDGDVVEVAPLEPALVRRGDVILARSGGNGMMVHRVVGHGADAKGPTLTTWGDALPRPDGDVHLEQVLGLATAVEGAGGRRKLDRGLGRWLGLLWVWTRPAASRALALGRAVWGLRPASLQ